MEYLLCGLFVISSIVQLQATICRDPPNLEELTVQMRSYRFLHESHHLLPQNEHDISPQYISTSYTWIHGNMTCPRRISLAQPLERHRSFCPTYYVFNHDINRIPATIVEANCTCETCVMNTPDATSESLNECIPTYYNIRVLRRIGCTNGFYDYALVWEPIRVGCHCVYPYVIMVDGYGAGIRTARM